jgi:ubiquinone/menaquinone biosynthesis C-methylase UbiE
MNYTELEQFVAKHYPGYSGDVGVYFKKLLDTYITPGCSLLDVGCGRQSFGGEFYARAKTKVGIDLEAEAIKEHTDLDTVVCASIEAIPFPDNTFDVVIAQWVFEHVADAHKTVQEINRVLKPGGVFIYMTPNAHSPFIIFTRFFPISLKKLLRKKFLAINKLDTFPTHYRLNTLATLHKIFASTNISLNIQKNPACEQKE